MMHQDDTEDTNDWIAQAQLRGFGPAIHLLLDVIAPLGPLGAQLLWIIQPASGLFGWQKAVGDIATTLEEPGGIEKLHRRLSTGSAVRDRRSEDHLFE